MVCSVKGGVELSRGGVLVKTSSLQLQFGIPPESIKDTMVQAEGVPTCFVLGRYLFDLERGINLAELEFPIYFNFFVTKRKITVVCEHAQKERLLRMLEETLFPPVPQQLQLEFVGGEGDPTLPQMETELRYFQRHPQHPERYFTFDDFVQFVLLEPSEQPERLKAELGSVQVILDRVQGRFEVFDGPTCVAELPWEIRLPPLVTHEREGDPFLPPIFGVTALGTGSGFDPASATSGFIVWVNGRGIMVDPPVDSTLNLREERIAPRLIQDVILTHCHADHDAGVLQKVLEEGVVRLYTTPSIMEGFIRKASLITGLSVEQLQSMIEFHPVPVGVPFAILGAHFVFKYNFHSVPTLRFQVFYGGRNFVYSSDILNIPSYLEDLREKGILSPSRCADLLSFPWNADLIIHEAGIPPLHTPPAHLASLSADVKKRLYVVHTSEARVKVYPDLRMMCAGIAHTLTLDVQETPSSEAHRVLRMMASNDQLRHISVERAADLLHISAIRNLVAGEYLIRKGEVGAEIYLLLHGEVTVLRDGRAYKIYGAGELVGDMALVNDEPRFADVVARSNLRYLAIQKGDFISVLQRSGVLEYLQHLAAIRKQDSWPLLEQSPVFEFLTVSQRTQLQGLMLMGALEQGELLSSEQLQPPELWLLIQGRVVVKTPRHEGALGRGAVLGTFAAPAGWGQAEPFRATVVEPIKYYRIAGPELQTFLERNPGVWLRLNRRIRIGRQLESLR